MPAKELRYVDNGIEWHRKHNTYISSNILGYTISYCSGGFILSFKDPKVNHRYALGMWRTKETAKIHAEIHNVTH